MNDTEILKIHGYVFSDDSELSADSEAEDHYRKYHKTRRKTISKRSSSDSGHSSLSDFDDEYYALQPPPVPISEYRHLIVKIKAKDNQDGQNGHEDSVKPTQNQCKNNTQKENAVSCWKSLPSVPSEATLTSLQEFPPLPKADTQIRNNCVTPNHNCADTRSSLTKKCLRSATNQQKPAPNAGQILNLQEFPALSKPRLQISNFVASSCKSSTKDSLKTETRNKSTDNEKPKLSNLLQPKHKNKIRTAEARSVGPIHEEISNEHHKCEQQEHFNLNHHSNTDLTIIYNAVKDEPRDLIQKQTEVLTVKIGKNKKKTEAKSNWTKLKKEPKVRHEGRSKGNNEDNYRPVVQTINKPVPNQSNNFINSNVPQFNFKKCQLVRDNRALQTRIRIASSRRYKTRGLNFGDYVEFFAVLALLLSLLGLILFIISKLIMYTIETTC